MILLTPYFYQFLYSNIPIQFQSWYVPLAIERFDITASGSVKGGLFILLIQSSVTK